MQCFVQTVREVDWRYQNNVWSQRGFQAEKIMAQSLPAFNSTWPKVIESERTAAEKQEKQDAGDTSARETLM